MTTHYRETVSDQNKGSEYVLSDGSLDRHGTRINPAGWDLSHFRNNPKCLFVHGRDLKLGQRPLGHWHDVRVEGDRLVGRLEWVPKGTVKEVDEIHALADLGFLKATSVGFEPSKFGDARKGEYDFVEQQLLEASIVSIGSNPNALMKARSLGISERILSALFDGEHADIETRDATAKPGGDAVTSRIPRSTKMELPISKRIENAQNDLNQARDALTEHMKDEAADAEQTDVMASEINARAERLESMKRAERALAPRPETPVAALPAPAIRRPLGVQTKEPAPDDLIFRAATVQLLAYATSKDPIRVLEDRYGDHEATQVVTRAAIAGATTAQTGWALQLVETATEAFMESLRPLSVFPQLAAQGTSLSFGPTRGAIKIPSRLATPSITGSFVGENGVIPVRKLGLTSITLYPFKLGVISVFTREIARYSNPQIEGLLRQEILADTALTIDSLLIDAVAGTTVRPAGLLDAVSPTTAATTPTGYAAILADINALAAPFDAANAGRKLVLIMNPREARQMMMAPGPDGTFGWASQITSEFRIIRSTTVPAGKLVMVDAADFVSVVGTPEFEVSEHTVLHMEDTAPLPISATGTPNTVAAPVQSMFQTASLALRMLLDTTWAMRRTGMVQFMTGADWT